MKIFNGKVISKIPKTAVVEVGRKTVHPMYKKVLKRSKKYKVDTGDLTVSVGDRVSIIETRPISKDKHFKIREVLKWFNIEQS